jgi:hypothetical protein
MRDTALREEYAGLFACLPVGLRDLHGFVNGNDPCAVASFISKLMCVRCLTRLDISGTFFWHFLMLWVYDVGFVPAKWPEALVGFSTMKPLNLQQLTCSATGAEN